MHFGTNLLDIDDVSREGKEELPGLCRNRH